MGDSLKPDGVSSNIPAAAFPSSDSPSEIASNVNYHAQYSPHFSPFKFDSEQAYFATAESIRDRLLQVLNFNSSTLLVMTNETRATKFFPFSCVFYLCSWSFGEDL